MFSLEFTTRVIASRDAKRKKEADQKAAEEKRIKFRKAWFAEALELYCGHKTDYSNMMICDNGSCNIQITIKHKTFNVNVVRQDDPLDGCSDEVAMRNCSFKICDSSKTLEEYLEEYL